MPGPGKPGHETWENGSWAWTGNTGVWTQITVDPEAGLVYLPVETPTIDEYGGNRPGDNLYAESLVAVDLKTGAKKWHFQFVHHPLWDHDMSSAPLLMDVTIDGKPRKVVAVPSKQGWLYVFDRITGVSRSGRSKSARCRRSDMPGEKTAKTQPFVTKPPAYARTHVTESDLIDFTPALRAQALENLKLFRWEQTPYVPPVGPNSKLLGAINIGNTSGGTNWPGAGLRSGDRHLLHAGRQLGGHRGEVRRGRVPPREPGDISRRTACRAGKRSRTTDCVPRARVRGGAGRGGAAAGRGGAPRRRVPRRGRSRGARLRARRPVDPETALRRDLRDRRQPGHAEVAGAARRHAGQRAQQPAAQGDEHPEDRPGRQRRRARSPRRSSSSATRSSRRATASAARACARMTRTPARRSAKCGCPRRSAGRR